MGSGLMDTVDLCQCRQIGHQDSVISHISLENIRPGDLFPNRCDGGGDCIPYVSVYQYVLDISIFTSNVVYMDSVSSICTHIISHMQR